MVKKEQLEKLPHICLIDFGKQCGIKDAIFKEKKQLISLLLKYKDQDKLKQIYQHKIEMDNM